MRKANCSNASICTPINITSLRSDMPCDKRFYLSVRLLVPFKYHYCKIRQHILSKAPLLKILRAETNDSWDWVFNRHILCS